MYKGRSFLSTFNRGDAMDSEVPYGTLDLMVLKTLALGPLHGYGIARRIERRSPMECPVLRAPSGT